MRKSITKMIKEFKSYWKNFVFQTLFAIITVFIVLFFLNIKKEPIIIAAIGSTAFIIFAMPKALTAKSRNVIGGHLSGILSGSLCALIPHSSFLCSAFIYSLAVGFSIFLMVVLDVEHPPAAGTALGVAVTGFSLNASITIIISSILLSLVHHFCKPYLRDLT